MDSAGGAAAILGDEILKEIAQTLVKQVRGNISIDWELKESNQAHMRVIVKRILRKYGYPPDRRQKATETVVKQAELLSKVWMATWTNNRGMHLIINHCGSEVFKVSTLRRLPHC